MAKEPKRPTLRIELTAEQRAQIKEATGKEVTAMELTPEALEERAAPGLAIVFVG